MKALRILKKILTYTALHILKLRKDVTTEVHGIKFCVNKIDRGGNAYLGRFTYQEASSQFYRLIKSDLVLDIGANYGVTSVIFAKKWDCEVVTVEPDHRLNKYIEYNSEINNVFTYRIAAICGEYYSNFRLFALNPLNSQDNRVKRPSPSWRRIETYEVTIDSLLPSGCPTDFVFIKSDTQGYEKQVIMGGQKFLNSSKNWLMRMEFAPYLLEQQGTDSREFLEYLVKLYDVVDYLGVQVMETDINNLFRSKVELGQIDTFIERIKTRDKNDTGWLDLLIRPK